MKFNSGANGGRSNADRGFTVIGKVVAIVAAGEGHSMEIEPIKGSMKGEKILVSLDPGVEAVNSKFKRPEITDQGIKYPNGYAGVGAVMAFEGAKFTSDKDAEQRTMVARWPLKMNDDTVIKEDISLIHFGEGRIRSLFPGKGSVVTGADNAELKEALAGSIRQAVAAADADVNFISLFSNDGTETSVDFIYLQTRNADNKYVTATDAEIDTQIETRLNGMAAVTEVTVVPAGFINKSEYVQDIKLRVGVSPAGVPVTVSKYKNGDDVEVTGVRIEQSGLAALGLAGRNDNPNPMTDAHIYGRVKGQVESFGPDVTEDARDAAGAAEAELDKDDPFADFDAESQGPK